MLLELIGTRPQLFNDFWDIQVFDSLTSTQDVCIERAREGAGEGLVVQALTQRAGRGRHGRVWDSQDGHLTCSFLLKPDCSVQHVGQISILIGVALAQSVQHFEQNSNHKDVCLKWPNDVLLRGAKCAGILIDSDLNGDRINWLVIGVGANTGHASCVGSGIDAERDAFLKVLLDRIEVLYALWRARGFADIRETWLELTYTKGVDLNVGRFESLDEFGNLVVRDDANALQTISAGDVFLKDWDYAAGD